MASYEYRIQSRRFSGSSEPVIDLVDLPRYEASVTILNRQFLLEFGCRAHSMPGRTRQNLKPVDRVRDVEKEMGQCKLKEIELIARCFMCLVFFPLILLKCSTKRFSNTSARRLERPNLPLLPCRIRTEREVVTS
jgi:hypothetical protein